jgi:DNA-binding transcriptional regulator YbjK
MSPLEVGHFRTSTMVSFNVQCDIYLRFRPKILRLFVNRLLAALSAALRGQHKASASRNKQARSRERVDLLLATAAALFAQVGYEALTTNAIAGRAGVSIGSLSW